MNREPIRSPARSVANREFHQVRDVVDETARLLVTELGRRGIRALNPPMAFPMEVSRFPKVWVVALKPLAVAAGLGHMGMHRNVIHPRFGSFVLLGAVLVGAEATAYDRPLDYNPCMGCKLCVSACPVGAISPDGYFNVASCYTHNYRDFLTGFSAWVDEVADSTSARDYRRRVDDAETLSVWQSLSFGGNYKSAYCLSVCPAGEEVIAPFLTDRAEYLKTVVRPLQAQTETVYVVPGSDAEAHVSARFPHKRAKRVRNKVRIRSIAEFLFGLRLGFQPGKAAGLDATYHLAFTGSEVLLATVVIRDGSLQVIDGHVGTADVRLTADSQTWLSLMDCRDPGWRHRLRLLLRAARGALSRKIRITGSLRLLSAFQRCFPG
jgi:ferredoxin